MGTEMVAFSKKDDLHPVAAVVPSARIIEHNVCVMEVYFPHFSAISRSVVVAWDRVPLLSAHMTGFPDQPTPRSLHIASIKLNSSVVKYMETQKQMQSKWAEIVPDKPWVLLSETSSSPTSVSLISDSSHRSDFVDSFHLAKFYPTKQLE